jgi:hypothetical protein
MISRYWSIVLLVVSVIVLFSTKANTYEDKIYLQVVTFKSDAGWGYNILANHTIYIHQPNIPALSSNKPFGTQQQALLAAQLVIQKIKQHKQLAITTAELDSLGIH